MNDNQQLLVSLLSDAIHGKTYNKTIDTSIDWEELYVEAQTQGVATFLFPLILLLEKSCQPNEDIMTRWKNITIRSGIIQIHYMNSVGSVLQKFHDIGILIIVMKGLLLRNLYPQPELRSMSDVDILVREEDIEKAKSLLISIGYTYNDDHDPKEIRFYSKNNILIELHWRLTVPGYIEKSDIFEKSIWKNAKDFSLMGIPVKVLAPDDFIIHLCLHMIFHLSNSGFGLRMLCDLVLLVEAERNSVDWVEFNDKIKLIDIKKFIQAIFIVCNRLFNMELPPIPYEIEENDLFIDAFIKDIFSSGHNKEEKLERKNINELIKHSNDNKEYFKNKLILILKIVFPTRKGLAKNYLYLYKYPFLYPVAWGHHLYKSVFKKNMIHNISSRFKFSKKTHNLYQERANLFKWLGLK